MPNLNTDILRALPLYFPSLSSQKCIAVILDKADAILSKREKSIGLTEELLRSAFLERFGDPVANPRELPIVTLGDIADDMTYGTSRKC